MHLKCRLLFCTISIHSTLQFSLGAVGLTLGEDCAPYALVRLMGAATESLEVVALKSLLP